MPLDNGVERTLGKILATQESILKELERHNGRLEEHIKEDKEILQRVNKIEDRFTYLYGFIGAIVFVFSLTSDILLKAIGLKI